MDGRLPRGDAGAANQWIAENGITDETCSIHVASGHDNGMPCSAVSREYDRRAKDALVPRSSDVLCLKMGREGTDQEAAMMQEIYQRGPISCGVSVTDNLLEYTGGIFTDHHQRHTDINHDLGRRYGVEEGRSTGWCGTPGNLHWGRTGTSGWSGASTTSG